LKRFGLHVIIIVLFGLLVHQCTQEPEVKTVTKIEYIEKTDTITKVKIDSVPITRYVNRIKTVKGKDSIIYREVANDTTIEAREYKTELESDSAKAKLSILTTGELLDVKGTISYPKEIKTVTTFKNASGLFAYGQSDIQLNNFSVGLDYVYKNKIIIGVNTNYNVDYNYSYIGLKLGFRIK